MRVGTLPKKLFTVTGGLCSLALFLFVATSGASIHVTPIGAFKKENLLVGATVALTLMTALYVEIDVRSFVKKLKADGEAEDIDIIFYAVMTSVIGGLLYIIDPSGAIYAFISVPYILYVVPGQMVDQISDVDCSYYELPTHYTDGTRYRSLPKN